MVIEIFGVILAIVIAVGLFMSLMVWKKKTGYRVFFTTGIIVASVSVVLIVISFILQIIFLVAIPILVLGLIYLIIGLVYKAKWRITGK